MASFPPLAPQDAIKFTSMYRAILNTRPLSVMPVWISSPMSQLTYEVVEVYNYPLAIFDVAWSQVYSIHINVDGGAGFPDSMQSCSITRKPVVRRGQLLKKPRTVQASPKPTKTDRLWTLLLRHFHALVCFVSYRLQYLACIAENSKLRPSTREWLRLTCVCDPQLPIGPLPSPWI